MRLLKNFIGFAHFVVVKVVIHCLVKLRNCFSLCNGQQVEGLNCVVVKSRFFVTVLLISGVRHCFVVKDVGFVLGGFSFVGEASLL